MTADTTSPSEGPRAERRDDAADGRVLRHYASLASSYDRTVGDWHEAVTRQSRALDAIIGAALGISRCRVLDCACGIGTQSIGLALQGHRVLGTDISPEMIARAEAETAAAGADAHYQVADMRTLERASTGSTPSWAPRRPASPRTLRTYAWRWPHSMPGCT